MSNEKQPEMYQVYEFDKNGDEILLTLPWAEIEKKYETDFLETATGTLPVDIQPKPPLFRLGQFIALISKTRLQGGSTDCYGILVMNGQGVIMPYGTASFITLYFAASVAAGLILSD